MESTRSKTVILSGSRLLVVEYDFLMTEVIVAFAMMNLLRTLNWKLKLSVSRHTRERFLGVMTRQLRPLAHM